MLREDHPDSDCPSVSDHAASDSVQDGAQDILPRTTPQHVPNLHPPSRLLLLDWKDSFPHSNR